MREGNFRRLKIKENNLRPITGAAGLYHKDTYQYKNYFLKFNSFHCPSLIPYEYLSYQIADNLQLDIPEYGITWTEEEKPAFITKAVEGNLQYAAKALRGINYTLEDIVENITNPNDFIDMCLFDGLVLNTDRHGGNFMFFKDKTMAPMIDNHTSYAVEKFKDTGLSIPLRDKPSPGLGDYIPRIIDIGYGDRVKLMSARLNLFDPIGLVKSRDLGYNKEDFISYLEYSIGELHGAADRV